MYKRLLVLEKLELEGRRCESQAPQTTDIIAIVRACLNVLLSGDSFGAGSISTGQRSGQVFLGRNVDEHSRIRKAFKQLQ